MPEKLLIISSSVGRGGADRQLLNLAYQLQNRDYSIRIVSLSPLGIMGYEGLEKGLDISCINLKKKENVIPGIFKILSLMLRWKPKLVVTFMFHASMIGRLLKMLFLVRFHVSSVRNERIGGRRRERIFRFTSFLDSWTTANSKNAANLLTRKKVLDKRKTVVIPNSVEVERYERAPEDRAALRQRYGIDGSRFVWIIVARIVENKDYDTLFKAMTMLVGSGKDPLLRIVGVGRLLEQIKKLAHDLHLDGHVEFLGARTDIPELLKTADCFVLSSAWEGMPNVILEAMSASLPVVATDVGGVSELVDHNGSGYLVESKNAQSLYEAMKSMMEISPEERAEMGRRGHAYITENHTVTRITDLWVEVFQQKTLSEGPGRCLSSLS